MVVLYFIISIHIYVKIQDQVHWIVYIALDIWAQVSIVCIIDVFNIYIYIESIDKFTSRNIRYSGSLSYVYILYDMYVYKKRKEIYLIEL